MRMGVVIMPKDTRNSECHEQRITRHSAHAKRWPKNQYAGTRRNKDLTHCSSVGRETLTFETFRSVCHAWPSYWARRTSLWCQKLLYVSCIPTAMLDLIFLLTRIYTR
jgi:hypothetical protein